MVNKKRLVNANFAQHIANVELSPDDAGTVQWVLSHTPTVDAVEVVRCKDCAHCLVGQLHLRCIKFGYLNGYEVKLDDFCSHGERRW